MISMRKLISIQFVFQTANPEVTTDVIISDPGQPKPQIILSKDGIPLNEEGVASPARVHIRSVQEGGKANPKRLQFITISSPKSKKDEILPLIGLHFLL